jgi:hypothetical protein
MHNDRVLRASSDAGGRGGANGLFGYSRSVCHGEVEPTSMQSPMYLPNDLPRDEFLDQLNIWADLHRSAGMPLSVVVVRYPRRSAGGGAGAAALRRGLGRDFGARSVSCRLNARALALLVSDATARELVVATRAVLARSPELARDPAGLGVVELRREPPRAALVRAMRLARLRTPRGARPAALGARASTWSLAGAEREDAPLPTLPLVTIP